MMTLDDLCAHLLPPDDRLTFQSLIIEEPRFILVAIMRSPHATCPDCHQTTQRIHGHYPRTLADLPWATAPIELRLIVRRFRCCTGTCRRQTFAERLPSVAPLYARTTTRLATTQANTGLALGGAAGARHLARHGFPGSRNTLLRRVRRLALPEGPEPAIIGIDDWAWLRGKPRSSQAASMRTMESRRTQLTTLCGHGARVIPRVQARKVRTRATARKLMRASQKRRRASQTTSTLGRSATWCMCLSR